MLDKTEDGGAFKVVGTRPERPDGVDKVTGRARFGADIRQPGPESASGNLAHEPGSFRSTGLHGRRLLRHRLLAGVRRVARF